MNRLASRLAAFALALTVLRMLLASVIAWMAFYEPIPWLFAICLVLAFLSDVFDGILARRFEVATANVRRLDSAADTVFYLAVAMAVWGLYPGFLREHLAALLSLGVLEMARYAFDLLKFRREAGYHMWSSRLWRIFLFLGSCSLLVMGEAGLLAAMAIYVVILANVEGLAISFILEQWRTDALTVFHAVAVARPGWPRG